MFKAESVIIREFFRGLKCGDLRRKHHVNLIQGSGSFSKSELHG